MSRCRWGSWGDPLNTDDAAGGLLCVVAFWLVAALAHWVSVEPQTSVWAAVIALWSGVGELLLLLALPVVAIGLVVVGWAGLRAFRSRT